MTIAKYACLSKSGILSLSVIEICAYLDKIYCSSIILDNDESILKNWIMIKNRLKESPPFQRDHNEHI